MSRAVPTERVTREELVKAIRKMKPVKLRQLNLSEVNMEILTASGEIGIKVIMELCQHVLDGRGMPIDWKMSVVLRVTTRVMERRIRIVINLKQMQFVFVPGKGTTDSLFMRRNQEKNRDQEQKL